MDDEAMKSNAGEPGVAVMVVMPEHCWSAAVYAAGLTGYQRGQVIGNAVDVYTAILDTQPGDFVTLTVANGSAGGGVYVVYRRTPSVKRRSLIRELLARYIFTR